MYRFPVAALCAAVLIAPAAAAQGAEQLWRSNCISCHGERGQGGGAGTQTLLSEELMAQELDRRFFDAIQAGVPDGGMPAFGETLTPPQVWALVNHIRALQSSAARKSAAPRETKGVYRSTHAQYRIDTVVGDDLDTPWSVDFLPDGAMLITERPGRLRVFRKGKLSPPVSGIPKVVSRGQGGMMDVAVHPDYARSGWVFLSFSAPAAQGGGSFTRLVRGRLKAAGAGWTWTDEQTIFDARPEHFSGSTIHYGCRIVFDPKDADLLYFCIGERGQGKKAQDLKQPNGKVFRIRIDGTTPADNPFAKEPDAYGQIWSYGHRNPQGLCFDLAGNLWTTEHGPRGGDELNLVRKGQNYGWPLVSFGIEYSGAPLSVPWADLAPAAKGKDIAMPAYRWMPSCAACGLDVVRPGPQGEAFPGWKGDLVAGGLAGTNVDRLRVTVGADGATTVVEREVLLLGKGRVRDVVCGPDGAVYVALNDPHRVVRLVPVAP